MSFLLENCNTEMDSPLLNPPPKQQINQKGVGCVQKEEAIHRILLDTGLPVNISVISFSLYLYY